MSARARYGFGPDALLEIDGPAALVGGFAREYGRLAVNGAGGPADVRLSFGPVDGAAAIEDRYKTVAWRVALSDPGARPLRARIEVRGRPKGFARSLVQGFIAEPLLSVAVARSGRVLLPAAAVEQDGGAILLVGRSRSGKTTLMAGAAARGRLVLGDDQVLVDADGRVAAFPRRLRLYTDLPETAPDAHRRLGPALRARLRVLTVLRRLSRGWIAPSLPVPVEALGSVPGARGLPLRRIVLIERSGDAGDLRVSGMDAASATTWALPVLAEQRQRLAAAGGPWPAALAEVADVEAATLARAFEGVPAERVELPDAWDAPRSVAALAAHLGLDR